MAKIRVKLTIEVDLVKMPGDSVVVAIPVQQLAAPLVSHVESVIGPQTDLDAGIAISQDQQSFLIEFRPMQGAQPKL